MTTSSVYIFAGGGTGGHLYPALAVAEELAKIVPQGRIVFACSDRPIDRRVLDATPYAIVPQPVRPLPHGVGDVWSFARGWLASRRLARDLLRDLSPSAVLGLGGFAAGPLVRQAAGAGLRCGLLNPDAVPGKANRYLARCVSAIFTQFDSTRATFKPRLQSKVRAVGCPVRAGLTGASRDEAMRHFELRADLRTLVVLGGSLGAASINDAISSLAGDLEALGDSWQLLHVTGPSKSSAVPM